MSAPETIPTSPETLTAYCMRCGAELEHVLLDPWYDAMVIEVRCVNCRCLCILQIDYAEKRLIERDCVGLEGSSIPPYIPD